MTFTCWRPPGARACGKGPGRAAAAGAGARSLVASRAGWRARAAGQSGALCRPARLGLASLLLVPAGPKPERGRGMKRTPLPASCIAVGGGAGRPAATRARAALALSGRPGPRTPTFRLAHARRGGGGQTLHTLAGRAPPLNPGSRRPRPHTHAHTPIARPPPTSPQPTLPSFPGLSLAPARRPGVGMAPTRLPLTVVANSKTCIGCTKRGTRRRATRTSGFRARMATPSGRAIIKARRKKGRKVLCTKSLYRKP